MIDQELIYKNETILKAIALGDLKAESVACELVDLLNETDSNYQKLIEDNAELHKVNSKLLTENKELYKESAKDKGL